MNKWITRIFQGDATESKSEALSQKSLVANSNYTYPGWKDDRALLQKSLDSKDAHSILQQVDRKQQVHDLTIIGNDDLQRVIDEDISQAYSGFSEDKKEAIDYYVQGYDASLKRALEGIAYKEKLHSGDRSDLVLRDLDAVEKPFSYAGWEDDKEAVENDLDRKTARRLLTSMDRKQQLHDGACEHDGIQKILDEGSFTYEGFEDDKVEAIALFSEGYEVALKRVLEGIDQKQRIKNGDRSDDIITELDKLKFKYKEWKKDKEKVENALDRKSAMRLLLAMKRKQMRHSGTIDHKGMNMLLTNEESFSYDGYAQDKKEALRLFYEGYELLLNQLLSKMDEKQKVHMGDRSDYEFVLADLNSTKFSYENSSEDSVEVRDRKNKDKAQKLFLSMKRKQQLHENKCTHPGILKLQESKFDYPGWDKDKESTLLLYKRCHDIGCQRQLDAMDQKQRTFDENKISGIGNADIDC